MECYENTNQRTLSKEELRTHVAGVLGCSEGDLIWSEKCRNPLTNYHHEDGTIKGTEGYWVMK